MAEQEQVTLDNITVLKPAAADAGPPAEVSPNERTIEPLDLVEEPKVRTKLRIYAIVFALCVTTPSSPSANTNYLIIPPLAHPVHISHGSNCHCNIHPYNLRRFALCFRLHLDRRRVLAGQRRSRSNLVRN
jgi:hypothetical protein